MSNLNNKKFKITNSKVKQSVSSFFACLIILVFIFSQALKDSFNDNPFLYVIIALVVSVIVAVFMAIVISNTFIHFHDDKFEIIKGKKVTAYSYKDFAGSNVVKHYMNGIYTGTTREIKMTDVNGKVKSISCSGVNKNKFAEIVSYLSKAEFQQTNSEAIPENFFDEQKYFDIPNDSAVSSMKKSMIVTSIIAGIIALATIVLWFIIFLDDGNWIAITILSLASLIGASIFIVPAVISVHKSKRLPDHIAVISNKISVGPEEFLLDKITSISMVPATYKNGSRDLVIVTDDGVKHKYFFGNADSKAASIIKDYGAIYSTLKIWCILNNKSFLSILG